MKKSVFTLFLLALIAFGSDGQTIRRVTQAAGITGVNIYSTIQAAHDAAVAGDIIYVEPITSGTYGNLIATKRLNIYGNGFFISNNTNTTTDSRTSNLSTVTLQAGTANSIISGISFSGGLTLQDVNITVTRCSLNYLYFRYSGNSGTDPPTVADNALISNCYFNVGSQGDMIQGTSFGYTISSITYYRFVSNAVIKNNIFSNNSGPGIVTSIQNSLITQNTVGGSWHAGNSGGTLGCNYTNNICQGGNSTLLSTANGNSFSNNISLGSAFWPTGNGNQNSVSTTNFWVGSVPFFGGVDNTFQLSASSIGLTAGINGSQVGAFGGISPYSLASHPPIPIITNLTTSGVGNSSTPLNVSVTVRGNN